jgi:RNA polymerase sigma-70 factor (ECF subfamily)
MTDRTTDHDRASPTDRELWERIRADDADAFRLLFDRHGPRIHRFATRRTGEPASGDDITAVVFLEAWRRRAAVDLVHDSAGPWLYGVANNVIRHWHRKRRSHAAALERFAALPPASSELVDRQVQAADDAAVVLEQIRQLPPRERDVLVLSVWEGLHHDEIAVALGIAVGTVKSRLSRARARLDPDRLPDRSPTTTTRSANPPAPTILTTEI